MRARRQQLRSKAVSSIKKISQECYDLTAPALPDHARPLLCQTELIARTEPRKFIPSDPSTPTQRAQSARQNHRHQRSKSRVSAFTAFDSPGGPSMPQSPSFYQKVYSSRAIELETPSNTRLYNLFKSRLSQAISGATLNASRFQLGPMAIKEVSSFLVTSSIEVLILNNNNLKDEGVALLCSTLPHLQLKALSLVSVNMGEKGSRHLFSSLSSVESLEELDLSSDESHIRNRLNLNSLDNISTIMGESACQVRVLRMNKTALDDHNFISLCRNMGNSCLLRHLEVSHNQITRKGFEVFKDHAIKQSIEYLDISHNKIVGGGLNELAYLLGSEYGLTRISKSFKALKSKGNRIRYSLFNFFSNISINQTVEELHLSDNPLGQGAISAVSSFLSRTFTLKVLDLSHSKLYTVNIMQLCNGLEHNSSLQILNLSYNLLDIVALETLLLTLAKKRSLSGLYLDGCGINDSYVIGCSQALMNMKYLEQLRLRNNFITDQGGMVLERVLFANRLLSRVKVQNNSLNTKMTKLIEKAAKENAESKKYDSPDVTYFRYMEEKQEVERDELRRVVEELKEEEEKLKFRAMVRHTAQIDQQIQHRQEQLKAESEALRKMEGQVEYSKSFLTSVPAAQDLQLESQPELSHAEGRAGALNVSGQ